MGQNRVGIREAVSQPLRALEEYLVSGCETQASIHNLKTIQVDNEHRRVKIAPSSGVPQSTVQLHAEIATVGEAGQHVMVSGMIHLFFQLSAMPALFQQLVSRSV